MMNDQQPLAIVPATTRAMVATTNDAPPRWTLRGYIDMHAKLLAALRVAEQQLVACEYILGRRREEIGQDTFFLCIVMRACIELTDQYNLDKDLIRQILELVIADNTYLPFGYSIIQKECVFLLASLNHDVMMGTDPLDVARRVMQEPGFGYF